jgi:hypothetical protein
MGLKSFTVPESAADWQPATLVGARDWKLPDHLWLVG